MKRLILWTLTLIILTTALTGGVVAYARTQGGENPLKAMGFDVCDGKPCFIGIVPGKTTWTEIEKLFATTSVTDGELRQLHVKFNFSQLYFFSGVSEAIPSAFFVSPSSRNLAQVGDFLNLYGSPCGTDGFYLPTGGLDGVFVRFPYFALNVYSPIGLSESQSVRTVNYSSSSDCPSDSPFRWSGFASNNRYEAQWELYQEP